MHLQEKYIDYQRKYAKVKLDGLPIRYEPVNTARQVYRLREGEVLKVLYKGQGSAVMSGKTALEGDWLRVLTNDGTAIDYTCARNQYTVKEEIIYNFLHYVFPKYVEKKLSKRYILLRMNFNQEIIPIQVPSGSCMLIGKDFFKSIGLFDPNTFLYWEESILFEKVKREKKQNYLNTRVKCIHLGGASTSNSVNSRFCIKSGNHSARYFMREYSNCGLLWYSLFYISTIFNSLMFELKNVLTKLKMIYVQG